MSEAEGYQAARESRAGVVSRAGHGGGSADIVRRMVDAAVYRHTHHAEPEPSTEDDTEPDDRSARE